MRNDWLGLEPVLSDQQSSVDKFLRGVHGGSSFAVVGALLLVDRYQRLQALGLALRSFWSERDCVVRW